MSDREALIAAYHAMNAACKWAAGETGGIKTLADADRHVAGYDALLDATVKAGQAAGILMSDRPPWIADRRVKNDPDVPQWEERRGRPKVPA